VLQNFVVEKIFVCVIFVVTDNCENFLTVKISRYTVVLQPCMVTYVLSGMSPSCQSSTTESRDYCVIISYLHMV